MKVTTIRPAILWLSIPLALLVAGAGISGLLDPGLYAAETANWRTQTMGQDWINLFLVVPSLLLSAIMAQRPSKSALYTWAAVNAYLLYTFMIYSTAVHFNRMFLVYCISLGLSFYSLAWFFLMPPSICKRAP